MAETAKTLWRAANPQRERLPAHFEERTRLCLRRIEEGSAIAPLEVFIPESDEAELFEVQPEQVNEAIGLVKQVFRAAEMDEPLPDIFPRALLPEFAKWGQDLFDDEEIEIETPSDDQRAVVTKRSRARLSAFEDTPYTSYADLTGEVLEADVRQRRFQVWIDDKTPVAATFSPELEDRVIAALRDHKTTKVHIQGRADFSPQGRPIRLIKIETWELVPLTGLQANESVPAIEDVLAELARQVPEADWNRLPKDLTTNLDHYLYGTPKR